MANDFDQNVNIDGSSEYSSADNSNSSTSGEFQTINVEREAAPSAVTNVSPEEAKKVKEMAKKGLSKGEIKRQSVLLIFSAIFVAYGVLFYYLPLAGWIIAFQNFKMKNKFIDSFFHSKFIGLKKFSFMFEFDVLTKAVQSTGNIFKALKVWVDDAMFIRTLRNTLGMGVLNLVSSTIMAILFALLLNEVKNKLGKKFVQTVSYLPHFLSWIIVTAIVRDTLSSTGIINELLRTFHVIDDSYNFFMHPLWFWPIVAISNIWKETGWNAIIYLAAITAIDPSLYEAAEIDGAGRINKIRYITLPGIAPTIMILLVMNIGNVLNAGFEVQYLLGNGIVQKVSQTIDIYVLEWGIGKGDYSLGTAAGIFKSVVAIILIVIANRVAKKSGQGSLF